MDLSKLDTKSPQEEGAFCHLKHTKFGHELYSGEGTDDEGRIIDETKDYEAIGVIVRGMEAPSVKKAAIKIEADLNPPKATGRKPISQEEAGLRFAEILVVGFVGLTKNGQPVEPTKENVRAFFQVSDNLVEQVLEFARAKPNFFGNESNG